MLDDFDCGVALGGVLALAGVLLARLIPAHTNAWYSLWAIMMVLGLHVVVRNFIAARGKKPPR